MDAFIVAISKVKDKEKFMEYVEKVKTTIGSYNGQLLIKGEYCGSLFGECQEGCKSDLPGMIVIIQFPDMESIDTWYNSSEYQALIPIRDQAADIHIKKFNKQCCNKSACCNAA